MNLIALKMIFGDRAKFFGIVMGVTLASLVITQQGAIFIGLMSRTFGFISDAGFPDVWVMDRKVQFIDDVKPLQDTKLYEVRGVEGVAWAVPLYKGMIRARLENGQFQNCNLIGLDDATLVAGPPEMVLGRLEDLRRADSVIIDVIGAEDKLARPPATPGGPRIPLTVGDSLELNDHRAIVVGICKGSRTFQSQPNVYTTYSRATTFAPRERKLLTFVLVKAAPGLDPEVLCDRIVRTTGLAAYTRDQFKWLTVSYFLKYTGIPINFGIAVFLGFTIGTVITGFMFYSFTIDNLRFFGTLKAMGVTNGSLMRMVLLQAFVVGNIGFGLGVGVASVFGSSMKESQLAFKLPWQLLIVSGAAVTVICVASAMLSMRRVFILEPAVVFKG
ncbi:MAG: FtsX-like permease family protein [Phycisphaerales bacterium]|nr:FtsX-like permease family protein [Phycisphaerales bacterium]